MKILNKDLTSLWVGAHYTKPGPNSKYGRWCVNIVPISNTLKGSSNGSS